MSRSIHVDLNVCFRILLFVPECRFAPVADPRKMFDIDAGIERDCAPSTVFDKKICTCVFSDEPFKKSKSL